ncbi:MAG: hypothetical protein WD063_11705 [Pirellulales bacterium]
MKPLAFIIAFIIAGSQLWANEPIAASSAVDLFERAIRAIRTYDVTLTVTRRWEATTEKTGTRRVGPEEFPILEWRPLKPGQTLPTLTHKWRQIRDARGRRRIEELDIVSGRPAAATVFDGEITRTLNEKSRQGYLGPASAQYVQQDEDYLTFYANELGEVPLVDILRERTGTRLIEDPLHAGAVVLDTAPEMGRNCAQFGYTIWLDAKHGMLPSRIDMRWKVASGEVLPWRQIVVRKFIDLPGDGWAPAEVSITTLAREGPIKGSPTQEAVAVVDVARSRWNQPLDESLFTLAFPPGISVLDDLRRVQFVTGNPRLEANLDELAKHAKKVIRNPLRVAEVPPRTNWPLILLVAVNVVILLAIVAVLWRRRAIAKSS